MYLNVCNSLVMSTNVVSSLYCLHILLLILTGGDAPVIVKEKKTESPGRRLKRNGPTVFTKGGTKEEREIVSK